MITTAVIVIVSVGFGFYMGYLKREQIPPQLPQIVQEIQDVVTKKTKDDDIKSFYE